MAIFKEIGICCGAGPARARAITRGVAADGRRLFPPMGFAYYARMDQRDLRDLVAYLRSLPAVE